jgi:hypothetical protein
MVNNKNNNIQFLPNGNPIIVSEIGRRKNAHKRIVEKWSGDVGRIVIRLPLKNEKKRIFRCWVKFIARVSMKIAGSMVECSNG